MPECLSQEQIEHYNMEGYVVLERRVPENVMAAIRKEILSLEEQAKLLTASNDQFDLDSHQRLRRIKRPDRQSKLVADLLRSDYILAPVRDLLGPNIRLQATKCNLKEAHSGAPVEWHQDWAFYPYTNDDIVAVGVCVDDMRLENAPLMVFPGTHTGEVFNHHDSSGHFCGAMDLKESGLHVNDAVPLVGSAGSVTIHHVRLVHGSARNTSGMDRRLLFFELLAADAFPIAGSRGDYIGRKEFDERILCGTSQVQPRMKECPVRLPYPDPPVAVGSLYDYQEQATDASRRMFTTL